MNRYRSTPGLGPTKPTATTTCQKCLKKGHYSYECKASLQERPYASRPSRSQLFKNPKLAPPLASEKPNELLEQSSEGVADRVLGEAQGRRKMEAEAETGPDADGEERRSRSPGKLNSGRGRRRRRSRSVSSVDSVSTISTNRWRSISPPRQQTKARDYDYNRRRANGRSLSLSRSLSRPRARKRRHDSVSSSSQTRSPPPSLGSHRKNRRHRTISPGDRGRPHSCRRGSRRSRSGSDDVSVDKSQVTKQRRLMDEYSPERPLNNSYGYPRRGERRDQVARRDDDHGVQRDARRPPDRDRIRNEERYGDGGVRGQRREERKERSLSPYSRRLALTQAMNMAR